MKPSWRWGFVWLLSVVALLAAQGVFAHPMGNFSINHYTRLNAYRYRLEGHYVLDMAEIPTVTEMSRLDANQDGSISSDERAAYLRTLSTQLWQALTLTINEQSVHLDITPLEVVLLPGAGGLKTLRLTLNFTASLPVPSSTIPLRIVYKDANYSVRTGWKEIVVVSTENVVRVSSVPSIDSSKELTVYPTDPSIAPPQVTEAHFTLVQEQRGEEETEERKQNRDTHSELSLGKKDTIHNPQSTVTSSFLRQSSPSSSTPRDFFTQSIAAPALTPLLMLAALISAFGFGALHALSPGHGKTMVAAYLIGTRSTAWHAVVLGLVVTLTHTLGVFALGLITLSASHYIVPERLYPLISGLSGLAVAGMGAGLLWQRLHAWHSKSLEQADRLEVGEHEEFYMLRRDTSPMSLRTLIGLGIAGGALPCPSALVVMLSAIALHRIGFGLLLIVSFSLGLAVVLTGLGLLMTRARGMAERFPAQGRLMAGLSVVSAGIVTVIGLLLFVRALSGRF